MEYNWTENLSPVTGVPMLDVPAGQDLPGELHPRDSYTSELNRLYQLVVSNHQQYFLSKISNPTEEQISVINRFTSLEEEVFASCFSNQKESHEKLSQERTELYVKIKQWICYEAGDPDVKEYDAQYRTISIPFIAQYIHDDDFFAYQRIAGNNPVSIHGVSVLPSNFPLTNEQYQSVMGLDDSLPDALSEKRVYMLDFNNIREATAENGYSKPATDTDPTPVIGYSYAAMALFAVSKTDNRLKSVAIQCGQDPENSNPMFLALKDEQHRWGWERAKMVIQAADKTEHQLASHLGLTHLLCEAFAVATIRKLKAGHPVYDLLISHFEGTNRINHNATLNLLGSHQFVDLLMAAPLSDLAKTSINIRLKYNFYDHFLPTELKVRGVDNTEALPEYPYRDDALLIWNSILDFVTKYLKIFYLTSAQITSDNTLNDWMDDLINNGKINGFKKITTRDDLALVLTMIIFTSSVQHAAVNFTQPSWMMYSPVMIGTLNESKPTTLSSTSDQWIDMLPILSRSMKKIDIYTLLGNLYNGYLGEYVDRDGHTVFNTLITQVNRVVDEFRNNLTLIENTIIERNKTRLYPYETLLPSKVPASINI